MDRKIEVLTARVEGSSLAPNPLSDPISRRTEIRDIIREERDMENRKLNLCVFNFPQSDNDRASFINLCSVNLNLNRDEISAGIVEMRRIEGAPVLDGRGRQKPRIMIVGLSTFQLKTKILKSAPKLRNYVPQNSGLKVYISPDYTKKQREERRLLNEELKRRRDNGEDVVVKRGEIVQRSG